MSFALFLPGVFVVVIDHWQEWKVNINMRALKNVSFLRDVPVALILLTRVPLPPVPQDAFNHTARSVWSYPIVGLFLGIAVVGLLALAEVIGIAPLLAAGLAVALGLLLTGGLHEDGLADCLDGLWGGKDRVQRLKIMKDSRLGAYGVMGLVIVLGLRWIGFTETSYSGIVCAFVLSRAAMPVIMVALPHARSEGLSHSVGRPPIVPTIACVIIGALSGLVLVGFPALLACGIAGLWVWAVLRIALRKLGGQTGDVLGATQVTCEILVLVALSALL